MKKQQSPLGNMVSMGVGNLVGVGMIGATAGMVNDMPAGTAKTITGIVPGLQGAALVGANLKATGFMDQQRRARAPVRRPMMKARPRPVMKRPTRIKFM